MGLLQMRYFKALAEKEHLTDTARELMVSAPSLSASINRLEQQLGYKLFDRNGKRMKLNECGHIYLKHVNTVFATLDNAIKEMEMSTKSQTTRLTVGISSPVVWLDAFQAFIEHRPDVKLSHVLIKTDQMANPSYCSQFDFIITARYDLPEEKWNYEILNYDDWPYFAVYPGHPFAERKEVSFIEGREESFIAVSKGYSMRRYFDRLCQMVGFDPKIVLECDYALRPKMLAAKYGIVFTTGSVLPTGDLGNAIFVKIADPPIHRTQVILWKKDAYLSEQALAFKEFMLEYHRNIQKMAKEIAK